jgi:uncharacterized protein
MTTSRNRARTLFEFVDAMDVGSLVEQFAPDAVMELPFAPGSMPRRYEGRDAISGFVSFVQGSFSSFSMIVDAVHETVDPAVVIVEHHSEGVVAANGRPYGNRYCTIITFSDDGMVTRWREYYDAGEVVRAFRAEKPR